MARTNRRDVARMFMAAGNGHFGSCYSCTEIVTALYFALMRVDAARPDWPDRDRFIFGKGHAAPTLYSALIRRGFMPEDWMDEFEVKVGARLMTHPSRRYQLGVDASLTVKAPTANAAASASLVQSFKASTSNVNYLIQAVQSYVVASNGSLALTDRALGLLQTAQFSWYLRPSSHWPVRLATVGKASK